MAHTPDNDPLTTIVQSAPLPPIDWTAIHQTAPVQVPLGARASDDPLPHADIVILTWTGAEWSALDQVFLGGKTERQSSDYSWRSAWLPYSRGAGNYVA